MEKSQILFSEFVKEDKFALNEYLLSLFKQNRQDLPTEQQEKGIRN